MQETLETWVRSLGWEIPEGGHGNPLQYSGLENPHGQGSPAGCSPPGHKESDSTERLGAAQHSCMWWNERRVRGFLREASTQSATVSHLKPLEMERALKILWKGDAEAIKWKSYVEMKTSLSCPERPLFSLSSSYSDGRYFVYPVSEQSPQKSLSVPAFLSWQATAAETRLKSKAVQRMPKPRWE